MPRSQPKGSRSALTVVSVGVPAGVFLAHFSEHGLARLEFPSDKPSGVGPDVVTSPPVPIREWKELTARAVLQVLSGDEITSLPPLDAVGTDFQQRVWSALRQIRLGETKCYSEIAAILGCPNAARAVGNACGANPIPLFIPCHRVLASGRKLGGFSAGLSWKKRLLALEGSLPNWPVGMSARQRLLPFAI